MEDIIKENERMLLDIDGDKKRYEKSTKKQQLQHDNFY